MARVETNWQTIFHSVSSVINREDNMSRRAERVAELVRREASVLLTEHLKDPRIGFVTVTRVKISDDLRSAVIYYTVFGDEKAKGLAQKGFRSAMPFIRTELSHKLALKFAPEFRLIYDDELESKDKIEGIFKKIDDEKKGQDAA